MAALVFGGIAAKNVHLPHEIYHVVKVLHTLRYRK